MGKFLLKDNKIYYIIFGTHKKIPLFTSEVICDFLAEEIFFYQNKFKFKLFTYSILPCHLNLLIKFKRKEDIENFDRDFKSYTTNYLLKLLDENLIRDY
ncbi:MAG: transposase, partial [Patescibacteria group bacterium]